MILLVLQLTASLTAGSCGELCSDEAVRFYRMLNASAAMTRRDSEQGAFLIRDASGRLRMTRWQPGEAARASYRGRVPAGCIAVAHTHPLAAPQPSRQDRAEAQRLRLPIVVVTPDAVHVATPDGDAVEILGAGWARRAR